MAITPTDSGSGRPRQALLMAQVQSALMGRYRIERPIGHGGMAVVFRACRVDDGVAVAIKVMRPELGYEDGVVERFRIEALAMGQLHHENIVEVRAHGEVGSILWIEMQLVDGAPLDILIRPGPLDWSRAARLLGQAASALAFAHVAGVIHRDIKPANLLVAAGSGRLLIADFGIARIVGASRLTATGTAVGTPAYMSPEQFAFDGEVTAATDQYSLGAVAWQMVTGMIPPAADSDDWRRWSKSACGRIRSLAPNCPAPLAILISRMIAVDPAARWPDLELVSRAAFEISVTGHAKSIDVATRRSRISAVLRQMLR
jgi:serine/threonine-protein kinase